MRVLAAALAVLLLVAICSLAEADPSVSSSAASFKQSVSKINTCCFSYISHPIPCRMISFTYRTSSFCAQPGVILVTSKERQVCADPDAQWVQECLKDLELWKY